MADYLMRDQAPLSPEQWEQIDRTVVEVARQFLVGRRFIPVYGPLGAGMQAIISNVFGGIGDATVDILGDAETSPVLVETRRAEILPMLYKDFRLNWRDIEASRQLGIPLDTGPAAAAAYAVALAEDRLIFYGSAESPGLLNLEKRTRSSRGDWHQVGGAFESVVSATAQLIANGFPGPYAVITSPQLYAAMTRVFGNTGVLEIEQIRQLATAGVFQTPILDENQAVVVATGRQNMDLAIGQDLTTAFLETTNMSHNFRVFEILALRVKRPGAVCTLE